MHRSLFIAGLTGLALSQTAIAGKPRELVIDLPAALASAPTHIVSRSYALPPLRADEDDDGETEIARSDLSPKEVLSRVRVGSWKWENGTALQLTGDRMKLMYGEKTRFNLTVRPFKDDGTINFSIHRGF